MLDPWFKRTYPLKHLKKWLYWPWADYRMLKNARAVFFTSESERSLARESFWLYRCTEQVVNYGTAGPVGDPHALREVFLQHYPKARGKKVLLFLGRIHPKKGPDLLLRALAVALSSRGTDQGKNVHVVMAGPNDNIYGQQMARLSSSLGLNERVTWTGMLTGDMKWGAYFAADAFTLPSHQENFGVSVAEALACSLPVLISNQVNIWREIEADGAGFVEADDVVGTKNLLDRWLQTPETDWMAMRARARGCYQARFAVAQAAESLARALTEFGAGRRR
jgi:glycosyltransferase involved in cell wall biosynthesis